MLHVFITVGHFQRCHELGLFGVRPSSINQLAQVRDGDEAWLYPRLAGALVGPYRCRGEVTYLGPEVPAPAWEPAAPGSAREEFRFVVGLAAERTPGRVPVARLYATARAAGITCGPADFVKRSVFTFLPAEGARMAEALARAPKQDGLVFAPRPRPYPLDGYRPVNAANLEYILRHEALDESLLEFILAREGGGLLAEAGARPAFNQLRIDDRGNRIDLVYAGADNIFIVELKRGRRDAEARRDILRYELWARGRRRELAAALGMETASPAVTPVLVAAGGPPRPADCLIYDWRLAPDPARLAFARVQ